MSCWAWLFVIGMTSGCATGRYTAGNLPDSFRAQPTVNVQTVQLAKLASPTEQVDLIAKGDVLKVTLLSGLPNEDELERTVRVADDGNIFLAELGHVSVEGLQLEAAEAMVATMCIQQDIYKTPQVTITTEQAKVNSVTIVGAVNEPGSYYLRSGQSNLLAALVKAGGLTEEAGSTVEIRHPGFRNGQSSPRIAANQGIDVNSSGIQLAAHEEAAPGQLLNTHGGTRTVRINLISATKEPSGGYEIPDGSVINVERHDPEPIHVMGLVRKPDEYEFPVGKPLTLTSAIAKAGDLSNPLADKVYVIRNVEGEPEPVVIQLSLKKAKERGAVENLVLAPGDTVSVEKTPATMFYDTIKLIGFSVGGAAF